MAKTKAYKNLITVIETLKRNGEFAACKMGVITKPDESAFYFSSQFAELASLELIEPVTWMGDKPNYALRCVLNLNHPPQVIQMDVDIYTGKSQLYLLEIEQKAFVLVIDTKILGKGALFFELNKMPKAWATLKNEVHIKSGWAPKTFKEAKMNFGARLLKIICDSIAASSPLPKREEL